MTRFVQRLSLFLMTTILVGVVLLVKGAGAADVKCLKQAPPINVNEDTLPPDLKKDLEEERRRSDPAVLKAQIERSKQLRVELQTA